MLVPKLHGLHVRLCLELHATASMLLAKSIAHHCNWLHGDLMVNALWLYGYDAPRSIVIVCLILLRILLSDLFTRVEDDVQETCNFGLVCYDGFWKPARKHWKLARPPSHILGSEEASIVLCDLHRSIYQPRNEVWNEEVLAKRGIAILQRIEALLDLLIVPFVHTSLEVCRMKLDEFSSSGSCSRLKKVPCGKRVQSDVPRTSHDSG
mmetsp:Transcript_5785/g.13739  ORF Transcript_5785/g.13739 Transcript_5785/m.13739 type:complete len:208 (+) Transcript_5785:145-768(+)